MAFPESYTFLPVVKGETGFSFSSSAKTTSLFLTCLAFRNVDETIVPTSNDALTGFGVKQS